MAASRLAARTEVPVFKFGRRVVEPEGEVKGSAATLRMSSRASRVSRCPMGGGASKSESSRARASRVYQYRGIPRHHFHLYLKETEFRFNQEDEDLFPIIASYLVNLVPISS